MKLDNKDNTFTVKTKITPWVKIPDIYIGKIDYSINGAIVESQTSPPFGIELNAGQVPEGSIIQLTVYNRNGTKVISKSFAMSSQVSVVLDGKPQVYEQPPVIRDGNTLTPLRAIFEAMGATVSWDERTQTATGRKGNTTVSLKIGDRQALKNGQPIQLEAAAQLINGHTMAPARFIGEAFGGELKWDGTTRTVTIKSANGKTAFNSAASEQGQLQEQQKPDSQEESGWLSKLALTAGLIIQSAISFIVHFVSSIL
ncbi:copper amine oxidase N-terminal domain-containing protein [Paenibacillus sp. RC67]|uniref:copper amine oxidase N-terminal domain-containing protein n=1 Tax=Paenibacillus sp. RC67 TaxID=3039392 RepID=UPI0024AD9944|nr:copper amine oxidase N-terminal domain-containing protein [Paenibacillus sp. RC67]